MFLLGLLLALTSRAQTPIIPNGAGFAAESVRDLIVWFESKTDKPSSFSLW